MKTFLKKALLSTLTLVSSDAALAHPGSHGDGGLMATMAHLLAQHGYLLAVVLCAVGVIAWQYSRRV